MLGFELNRDYKSYLSENNNEVSWTTNLKSAKSLFSKYFGFELYVVKELQAIKDLIAQ